MELILQQNLPHQTKAVDSIINVFKNVSIVEPVQYYENPTFSLNDPYLEKNIKIIQDELPIEYHSKDPISNYDYLNLDIKMETGTGKTYVYIKTIFELHKKYGFNKFIIAVPSLAIKAGTEQFMNEPYARQHFTDVCGYGSEIDTLVLETPKTKKKGRSYFPNVVSDFVKGSCQDTRKIYVLLVNMQLLTNGKMLTRDDYDYDVEGFYCPLDAIAATKPIIIIDEPHRFSRDQKAFKVIHERIKPQAIIRFGATFPEIVLKRNNTQQATKDYQNLLYDLNIKEAFNQGLIKGIIKEHLEPISQKEEMVKIVSIKNKDTVSFQYIKKHDITHQNIIENFTLKKGNSLSMITDDFAGITISEINKSSVTFSNGLEKRINDKLDVDVYMTSYQEQMIQLALKRHFEVEKENFCNRYFKIKTLALFFIDDISSYRIKKNNDESYTISLFNIFERLLKKQIETTIKSLNEHEKEYKEYLEASLANLSACHGGYFAMDKDSSDEEILKQYNEILNNKKQLISFKNEDGSLNTRRFIFSKWTLKEGWDNPNVFTITKLRSSGSETSKIQEVGRGLRLPVNENGNRISNENFYLNYIVDFTDSDFAQKLINQIELEVPYSNINIKDKIKDMSNKENKPTIKIQGTTYNKLKELWEAINRHYLLLYNNSINNNIEETVFNIFNKDGIFTDSVISSKRERIIMTDEDLVVENETGIQNVVYNKAIPYNVFLKRISAATNIPITILHSALCKLSKKRGIDFISAHINERTIATFCSEFFMWKNQNLLDKFKYICSTNKLNETALTYSDGTVKAEIQRTKVGLHISDSKVEPNSNYLYDTYAYDSELEEKNMIYTTDKVIAYGKIPKTSVAIPTITGVTYTPDFMYIIQPNDNSKKLNLIIETKDVANQDNIREIEKIKIECAKIFFEKLTEDGYTVYFKDQFNTKQIAQIIDEIINTDHNKPT